jgi:hypothetical protein
MNYLVYWNTCGESFDDEDEAKDYCPPPFATTATSFSDAEQQFYWFEECGYVKQVHLAGQVGIYNDPDHDSNLFIVNLDTKETYSVTY